MHVVECPKCHRKFRVPQPVSGAKMKCSRCGEAFVGSSRQEAAGPPAAKPLPQGAPGHAYAPVRQSSSAAGPLLLAAAALMVIGVIVMIIVGVKRYSRPRVIEVDRQTGQVQSDKRMSGAAAERQMQEHRAEEARRTAQARGGPIAATGPMREPDSPVDAPVPESDPKLAVSPPQIVEGGPVGEHNYAVGRVRSEYDVPLARVRVTIMVDDMIGPSETYQWLPAKGEIRYSVLIGSGEGKVTARAQAEKADPNVLVWEIPSESISRARDAFSSDAVVFTGEFTNHYDTPGTNVEVYVDYFASDGADGKRAPVGRLQDGPSVGAGKKAYVRFEVPAVNAPVAEIFVARAKGDKY